jgi:type II secretory ATPase GspE/PulE/Tfp pilus assembly ATPase PilB-like protein
VFEDLKIPMPNGYPVTLWQGKGCPECKNTGYRGRVGIYELMTVDGRFHDPIVAHAGAPEYERLARQRGMRTMFEDGIRKATQGITTIEELLRATRLAQH